MNNNNKPNPTYNNQNRNGKNNPYYKHGLSSKKFVHPLYNMWKCIKERCYGLKETHKAYKHYRGKGIIMCEAWKNNVVEFYEWAMANGWTKGLTIDRIDSNGNYEPNNCKFVTPSENSKKMAMQYVKYGEESFNAKLKSEQVLIIRQRLAEGISGRQIAKEFGIDPSTVYAINHRKIWKHI